MMHFFGCIVFRLRLQGWRRPPTPTTGKSLPGHDGPESRKLYGPSKKPGVLYDVIESSKLLCKWIRETLTLSSIRGLLLTEFVPCASKGWRVSIKTRTETRRFLFCSWWESTFTILHLIFGTLVFSGTLFVGTKDATGILGRYIAGVAVCRVVLIYELAGLRDNCNPMDCKTQRPDMVATVEDKTHRGEVREDSAV